jgi:hypothetical protein
MKPTHHHPIAYLPLKILKNVPILVRMTGFDRRLMVIIAGSLHKPAPTDSKSIGESRTITINN